MLAKKSSKIVKKNEKGKEVQTRVASSWTLCIYYGKLNW